MAGIRLNTKYLLSTVLMAGLLAVYPFGGVTPAAADSKWSVHNNANTQTPDYSPLDVFFGGYAEKSRGRTTFAYQSMGQRGQKFLADYLAYLESIPVSQLSRDQQLAYWLNLRNTAAMKETLASYPTRRVEALITGAGSAWDRKSLTVEGVALSFNDIENKILLVEWQDPRVIYGIYFPAKSAPPLPTRAFTGQNVYEMLDKSTKRYVNGRYAVTRANKTPTVSWIYQRFSAAFGDDDQALFSHLQDHAETRLKKRLSEAESVSKYSFDWALNEHKPRQTGGSSFGGGSVGSRGGGGFGS